MSDNLKAKDPAADELRAYIDRVERLNEDVEALRGDIKDIFAEAKNRGYDVAALRKLIALRKRDPFEVREEQAILHLYADRLDMDLFA